MEEDMLTSLQNLPASENDRNLNRMQNEILTGPMKEPILIDTNSLDSHDPDLILKLKAVLKEKNLPLLKSVIDVMGPEYAIKIANEVADIQSSGGIKSADGSGFRTPGGIFFQLVKKSTIQEVRKQIFEPIKKESKKRSQERKKVLSTLRRLKTSELSQPLELHHSLSDMTRKLQQEKPNFTLSPSILRFNL